jgi:hypothetical protein
MTFEEYKDKLLSRPPQEHEAWWTIYNYDRFMRANQNLIDLRDEALKLQQESKEPRQKVRT